MEKNLADFLRQTASGLRWQRIGLQRRAGVLAPLSAVYSKQSTGIGDLADLMLLVDWCKATGNSILQLLPMNEVGAVFCPYDAVSSFALEPAYLSLVALSSARDSHLRHKLVQLAKTFPAGRPYVDYCVKKEKLRLLWDLFLERGADTSVGYRRFIQENAYWLHDFSLFKVLKGHHEGRPWYEWEEGYAGRDPRALAHFAKDHQKEIVFERWVQWLLYGQFKEARAYAAGKDVLLKGDMPVLVSRDSADVWAHPEFFKLECAAGAPPDMYCAKGQRWGMPTYNWEAIAADGFRYLKEKLTYAENFYDILRIDHVVGLFRIWSIPYGQPLEDRGLYGMFDPPDESRWQEHGSTLLHVTLESTKMLLCAEDLGIIPKSCPETLKQLGIPGNDVQRWVKDWNVTHDFLAPEQYRFLSVAMLATHDTTNWAAWWQHEAGTVDEALFVRKCTERRINYEAIKATLFDASRSGYGRLRWQDTVDSTDTFVAIMGRPAAELKDFIELYENSFQEKERLFLQLGLKGPLRHNPDRELIRAALKLSLESSAVFTINSLIDWLYLAEFFAGDPYQYRFNTPGTVDEKNWSRVMPRPLEALIAHDVCRQIKSMVSRAHRI